MATTPTTDETVKPMRITLHAVPWAVYNALRDISANDNIRMTYLDGTLELMAPEFIHAAGSVHFGVLVRMVARAFGVRCLSARCTTLRRREGGETLSGEGREPDESFFLGAHVEQMRTRRKIDLEVDPPPDLVIEVDNTVESEWKLPVYARLRVPEIWRYDVNEATLWFGALGAGGTYDPIERSLGLPMLSRVSVLDIITRGEGLDDASFADLLESWIRDELNPPLP